MGSGQFSNSLNLDGVRFQVPLLNDIPQERNSLNMEFALLPLNEQFILKWLLENLPNMVLVWFLYKDTHAHSHNSRGGNGDGSSKIYRLENMTGSQEKHRE